MRFYIWFENLLDLILRILWVFVVWIHEIRNIRRKKSLFSEIRLNPDQAAQVNELWQQAYGKKISLDWNRLYQSYTGRFDARYFPEILYTTKLEPLMNPRHVCRVLSDKNLLGILLKDDEVKVPGTIISNAWGYLYDQNNQVIDEAKMLEILKDAGNIVIKPTVNTNSGKGITIHNIQNGMDLLSGENIRTILAKLNENYIIQEKLVAHSDYARLYDKSINTIRVVTYISNSTVHHAPLVLRMGRGGNWVDNGHAGGVTIGLTDQGILNKAAFSEMQDRFYEHPDSGVVFEGYVVPATLRIIEAAKRLHGRIPGIGIISWDFMIDQDENVVIIEVNLRSQTVWAPQILNGCGFFGENTEKMINLISKNQDRAKSQSKGNLKLLIINTIGLDFEGITLSIVSYLEAMDRSGLEIDFTLVSRNFNPEMLKLIKHMGDNIHILPLRMKTPFRYFRALCRLIKRNGYDIVHAHGNSATLALEMWAAKLAGCEVRIAHSRNTSTKYPLLNRVLRPFFYRSYTQGFASGMEAGQWLFGRHDFRVIPNGKDIARFSYNAAKRNEYRSRLNLNDKVVIGHAGNFNAQKNHEFLIRIFQELAYADEHYVLYLMGEGSLRPHIEKMVKTYELDERVVFTGSIANMADMLQVMDIMVLPSKFEGLPNVVLEWQTAGLPCVISDTITRECKVTDLVHYMSLQDGPFAWAEKIRSIEIRDREEIKASVAEQMRRAGFDIVENARQLKKIYFQLSGRGR